MNLMKSMEAGCCFLLSIALTALGEPAESIVCEGSYRHHLQGVTTDGEALYWSFTSTLVKTDLKGKVLYKRDVQKHHGDLCVRDGILYVAVNRGVFDEETGANSQVWSYHAKDLSDDSGWKTPQLVHGAGAVTWYNGSFYVVGGLPETHKRNYIYEYKPDFTFVKRHLLESGYTVCGIQTADLIDGRFWFGIYGTKGNPAGILRTDPTFQKIERFTDDASVGLLQLNGKIYTAITPRLEDKTWKGEIRLASPAVQK